MKIFPLEDSNLDQGIRFARRLNQIPTHKISYLGESEDEIGEDIKAIQPPDGYGFVVVSDHQEIVGLFGVEMDVELGRCWLFGPFVEHNDWDSIADLLYDALLKVLPEEISNQELFFPNENFQAGKFALRQGFDFYSSGSVLTLDSGQVDTVPESGGQDLDDGAVDQFIALHEDVFPNTYYSGKQLLKLAEHDDKRLFVHQVNSNLVGYIFIQVREAPRDGYIDFIGVDKGFRRQGIGTQLATRGINWAFKFPFVEKISLTVKPDNIPAVRMYQSLDFKTESVSQAYRKQT
jgi:ribosomal protein S18 acetylase RimI-like enzyme